MKKLIAGLLGPCLDKIGTAQKPLVESTTSALKARCQPLSEYVKKKYKTWKVWDSGWHFTPALWLLPAVVRKEVSLNKRSNRRKMARTLTHSDLISKILALADKYEMIRKPNGGKGIGVSLRSDGAPTFSIYCCGASFSDADPVAKEITKLGYTLDPASTSDQVYSMSRRFVFKKRCGEWDSDYIHLIVYSLKELGGNCRAVSLGYDRTLTPDPVEKFKLVCDEFEAAIVAQDHRDPNYL